VGAHQKRRAEHRCEPACKALKKNIVVNTEAAHATSLRVYIATKPRREKKVGLVWDRSDVTLLVAVEGCNMRGPVRAACPHLACEFGKARPSRTEASLQNSQKRTRLVGKNGDQGRKKSDGEIDGRQECPLGKPRREGDIKEGKDADLSMLHRKGLRGG